MAKRILIYTNHFLPEQFKINEIVNWMAEEDYEIRVVTGLPNYPSGKIYSGYGLNSICRTEHNGRVTINRLPLIPRGNGNFLNLTLNYLSYFVSCFLFTIFLIFKKKYDFIFVHHTSPILIAIHPIVYSFFRKGTRKYLWDLDVWPETLRAMNIVSSKSILFTISKLVQFIYSFYDKILISSNSFKETIQNRYSREIIYFPNWAEKEIEENIRTKNMNIVIPKDNFIIMYTGNIGAAQNFISLTSTIKELQNEKILWVFVGGGRSKNKFISKLDHLNLKDNCLFIDPIKVSKIPEIAFYADAMFLSLKPDEVFSKTVPAKLQSYMALRKPVIGVLQGEGAEIIKSSNCGIVEERADYLALANNIRSMLRLTKEKMREMGNSGREYYDKNFSQSSRKNQLLKLFS